MKKPTFTDALTTACEQLTARIEELAGELPTDPEVAQEMHELEVKLRATRDRLLDLKQVLKLIVEAPTGPTAFKRVP